MESRYYSQTPEQVLAAVESREEGLTSQQAQERLERFGPNALREEKKKPVWQVFLEQFKDLLVVILIAAAVISMLSGNVESTIVIFAVLVLNAILGTVQYEKAEKSLESLKAMSAPSAKVLRDGIRTVIPSAQVVPGDIVELGMAEEIFYDPRHPYTWALLSSLPQLGVKGEELFSIQGTPPNLFTPVHGDAFAPRNPQALKIDFVERPPYFEVSPTHKARTWLLDPRAPKVEPPKIIQKLNSEGGASV